MNKYRKCGGVGLLALLLVLVGCTGGGEKESIGANVSEQIQEDVDSESETEKQTRRVTDEIGHEIDMPVDPQRIIGIYLEDELTALGVKPLRQARIGDWSGQDYLNLDLQDIDIQGDVEAFFAAQPDFLLTNVYDPKIYDTLEKIAPFYAFKDARADWRATIRTLGELLNKSDKAEEVIAAYDLKATEAGERILEVIGDETVAIVRVHAKSLRLYGGPGYAGPVLYEELGLQPAQAVKDLVLDQNLGVANISLEVIPQLTADHIFLTMDTGADQQYKDLTENTLWKNLPAVKGGRVYEVNFETWMKSGPIADGMKIEDVVQALVK
ncbi:ABC transporter substrate-binding protein [Caldalkalibacillus mannanilyticus]|uniref:ABC transporter substrate-binding protein n=1 Tax=Caldalkalibacillus mannanilyticus TaxID=1418 RepID=UPI0004694137|nr:ABC transporter substrate-binding protein [Caldalkalibacillus mannanilyticus]